MPPAVRISSARCLPGFPPDQVHKHFVQGGVGLIETLQANSLSKAGLQDYLWIGMFAKLQFPIYVSVRVRRGVVRGELPDGRHLPQSFKWRDFVLGLNAHAAGQDPLCPSEGAG